MIGGDHNECREKCKQLRGTISSNELEKDSFTIVANQLND